MRLTCARACLHVRHQAIKDKAAEKERELADLAAQRKRENDIRRVEKEFELKKRLDRVDEISKVRRGGAGLGRALQQAGRWAPHLGTPGKGPGRPRRPRAMHARQSV